jgi:hypothetical protein
MAADDARAGRDGQRLGDRLQAYWQGLAGERPLPSQADLDGAPDAELLDHCLLIAAAHPIEDSRVLRCGAALRAVIGRDPANAPMGAALPPPLAAKLAEAALRVVRRRAPAEAEACYPDPGGNDVVIRALVLPLAGDDEAITLLCGISYKRLVYE